MGKLLISKRVKAKEMNKTKKNVYNNGIEGSVVRHLFCYFFLCFLQNLFFIILGIHKIYTTNTTENTTQTKSVTSFCNTKSWKKEMFLNWVHPQYELCFLSVLQMNWERSVRNLNDDIDIRYKSEFRIMCET